MAGREHVRHGVRIVMGARGRERLISEREPVGGVGLVDVLHREANEQQRAHVCVRVAERGDRRLERGDAFGVDAGDVALPAAPVRQRGSCDARSVANSLREPARFEQHLAMGWVADATQRFSGHRHHVDACRVRRSGVGEQVGRLRQPLEGLAVGELRERAVGRGDRRLECTFRFGPGFVPVAGERGAVPVEPIASEALDRLGVCTVESQPPGGGDLVDQCLLHERMREPVAHRRTTELVEESGHARGFERVDRRVLQSRRRLPRPRRARNPGPRPRPRGAPRHRHREVR